MKIVEGVTCTVSANVPEYVFQIALSAEGMQWLKRKALLCGFVSIQKGKYEFLNDLAAALTEEIVQHFEKMEQ
jgi:hypothetical protein